MNQRTALIASALAALSQPVTYTADVGVAKNRLWEYLKDEELSPEEFSELQRMAERETVLIEEGRKSQ